MRNKHFKNLLCLTVSAIMAMGLSATAFAKEADVVTVPMGDVYYYDSPQPFSMEETEINEHLLFSVEDIAEMTEVEFAKALEENTPLDSKEIEQIVSYYNSDDFKQGIAPMYGIYDHPEWQITPYKKERQKWCAYATSWIGIDAYRSGVGITKGYTETKDVSTTLGYKGSKEIEKYIGSFSAETTTTYTTTVNESAFCEPWNTINWRPQDQVSMKMYGMKTRREKKT